MFSILGKTIKNGFNEKQFQEFTNEFFNGLDFSKRYKLDISSQFQDAVSNFFFFAEYQDPKQDYRKIHILGVELSSISKFTRASTQQRNLIAKHLKKHHLSGALVAFYVKNYSEWRLSFVEMGLEFDENGKIIREFTPAKRSSFIVGQDVPSHTPLQQFEPFFKLKADSPTFSDIKEVFSVEKVTKDFFKELSNWYFWALANIQFPKDAEKEKNGKEIAVIRLITRLIFIWFMKRKGLVSNYLFDKTKLGKILIDLSDDESTYYKAILQNLFFATLSTPKRNLAEDGKWFGYKKGGSRDQDNNYVYRYKELFRNPKGIVNLFSKIPFLNGGLFECLDSRKKDIFIDGFTRIKKHQPIIPNRLFFSSEIKIDLNDRYGTKNKSYKVEGLINILKRYNFTIDENSPVDEEIALDPELLGRVFENLLASYNPETATTARKATGSYYTPRSIVHYMVDESLKAYLKTKLSKIENIDEKIKELFSYDTDKHSFNKKETKRLVEVIDEIKIIDPAVGSGAFPMGILQRLVYILSKLDLNNETWRAFQKRRILKKIDKTYDIKDKKEREKELKELDDTFNYNTSDYGRKLYLIKNCIYGVDIQPIAVQIAKLRFFISLLVDMEVDKNKKNYGIDPLPNLETKFVAANSLIGLNIEHQTSLFKTSEVSELEEELKGVRSKYFNASLKVKKEKLKKRDKDIREKIAKSSLNKFLPEATQKIANWDPYNPNISTDWFDSEWMFGISDGFDIVIANPPYIRVQQLNHRDVDYFKNTFSFAFKRLDISLLFFEKGLEILNSNGVLTYISSNQFLVAAYGEKARLGLLKCGIEKIIDFGSLSIFKSALTYTSIFIINKKKKLEFFEFTRAKSLADFTENRLRFEKINTNNLGPEYWVLSSDLVNKLLNKIKEKSVLLKDLAESHYGIISGKDEVCTITEDRVREEKIEDDYLLRIILPKNIHKWKLNDPTQYIIYPYRYQNNTTVLENETLIKKRSPNLYAYFVKNKKILESRKDSRKNFKGKKDWYGLIRFSSIAIFNEAKIVSPTIVKNNKFAFDENGFAFAGGKTVVLTSSKTNLKFLLAILNSKIAEFYYHNVTPVKAGGYRNYSATFILELPIKKISSDHQKPFINLIDKILATTKSPDYFQNETKQKKVKEYEHQIDQLIYKLYDLTPEEIKIVENYGR